MRIPTGEAFFSRISVKQGIYETIKDWIIERRLKPGERIYDTELAAYFKVSRTPVREALQLLETQKLVKTYPGKATFVTELETDNIEKWYQPMATLQQLAVTLAADKITSVQMEQLRLAEEVFKECVKEQKNPMPLLKADKEFHSCILDAADNEYIKDFCDVLWIHIQRLEFSFFRDTPMEASIDEHEQLIRALERKDGYFASLCMKAHWERTMLVINGLNAEQTE